jgi:hypothetical protein
MSCIVGSQVLLVATFKSCTVFIWFFRSTFPICSTILCTPILTVFFLGFSTWGFHSHFVEVWYTIGGPLGGPLFVLAHFHASRLIVVIHLTFVFPLLVDDTHIIGFALYVIPIFFMITVRVFSIKVFSATSKMHNLVST